MLTKVSLGHVVSSSEFPLDVLPDVGFSVMLSIQNNGFPIIIVWCIELLAVISIDCKPV